MKGVEIKIALPAGMNAVIDGKKVSVSKNGKQNVREFHAEGIEFEKRDNEIVLKTPAKMRKLNAVLHAVEAHIRNMINGLEKEYEYKLGIVYSHFPMTVAVKGNFVEINNFTGEKKPRKARIIGTTVVTIKGKEITIKGHDKEAVGQTAAGIENVSRVKEKDKRVFQDGIYITSRGED